MEVSFEILNCESYFNVGKFNFWIALWFFEFYVSQFAGKCNSFQLLQVASARTEVHVLLLNSSNEQTLLKHNVCLILVFK